MSIKIRNEKLKTHRVNKGFTRKAVAQDLGFTEDKIMNVEEGRSGQTKASVGDVEKLCDYYGLTRSDIINYDFRNTKVIVFGAGKGGTAKTTTAAEVSYHLSKKHKILVIDGDPQGNLSKMLGFEGITKNNLFTLVTCDENYIENLRIEEYIYPSRLSNVEAITFHISMYAADKIINQRYVPMGIFKKIKEVLIEEGKYDFVIVDTSPQISTYTMGLYIIADSFFIPLDLAPFTIDSLPTFLEALSGARSIKSNMWPGQEFKINGVIKTKADMRQIVAKEVSNFIDTKLPFPVMNELIPRTTIIEQAQYNGLFLEEFDKTTIQAKKMNKAYERLTREVLKNV